MNISTYFKYNIIINLLSIVYLVSLLASLYLIQFPTKRFVPINIFLNFVSSLYFYIFNVKHLIYNYSDYWRDFCPFYLKLKVYLSNHIILLYFLCLTFGDRIANEEDVRYITITLVASFGDCVTSGCIRSNLTNQNSARVEPTNLREIIVQPTFHDQVSEFILKIKGNVSNRDLEDKEEMAKSILDDILKEIFKEEKENEDDICSICLNELKKVQKIVKLECSHSFHLGCLFSCYQNRYYNCGLCRSRYLKAQV